MFQLPDTTQGGWFTLYEAAGDSPAVRVRMVPIGPSASRVASLTAQSTDCPIGDFAANAGYDVFTRELCRLSLVEWEGIADHAGNPAVCDEGNIDRLLSDPTVLAKLQVEFVNPFLHREMEKNVSPPSSSGTSPGMTGAKDIAADAQSDAKNAPTASTRRKPAKAKAAGK